MTALSLDQATIIVDAALAAGRAENMMPLTVAVLDGGGHLLAFKREDGSGILRPQVAIGKAWGALGMGQSSRTLRDRLNDRPSFIGALSDASDGRFIPVPGGVLIRDGGGRMIGAVGISGDTSDKDEFCAIAGVKAAALKPDPADPDPAWANSSL
ncbi:MAG: heme-binding protein [Alphaproteobacteria bacterium]|nr:heme-binding protein [Alphaproteobacteria bacterium]